MQYGREEGRKQPLRDKTYIALNARVECRAIVSERIMFGLCWQSEQAVVVFLGFTMSLKEKKTSSQPRSSQPSRPKVVDALILLLYAQSLPLRLNLQNLIKRRCVVLQLKKGGVAKAKGEGEKEKECTRKEEMPE